MSLKEPEFNGPEDFEKLKSCLPEDWTVEKSLEHDSVLVFDFPLPSNRTDALLVSMQAAIHGMTFEGSEDILFGGRTVKVDEIPGQIAERFQIDAEWPLPPNMLALLKSVGTLILDQTSMLPPSSQPQY